MYLKAWRARLSSLLVAGVLTATVAPGIASADPPMASKTVGSIFFPLTLGNSWVYRTVFQTVTITRRVTVITSKSKNGTVTATLRSQQMLGSGTPQGESLLTYIADAHGVYLSQPKNKRQLVFPLPVKAGTHWTEPVVVGPQGKRRRMTEHFWLVSRGPLRVGKRSFNDAIDIVYGTCGPHTTPSVQNCGGTHVYYAARVGQVQVATIGEPVTTLISYHVK